MGVQGGPGVGIIPARAGFTPYDTRADEIAAGSSPLARGLRVITGADITYALDHPRSRGVYERLPLTLIAQWGSSPLARGLRTSH